MSAEDITACQKGDGRADLRPDDIVVQNMKIDWSMKDKNPVDHVFFYQDMRSDAKFSIPKEKVSTLLPNVFQERRVRVFVKDEANFDAASRAFEAYQQRHFGTNRQVAETPPRNKAKKHGLSSFTGGQGGLRTDPEARKKLRLTSRAITLGGGSSGSSGGGKNKAANGKKPLTPVQEK